MPLTRTDARGRTSCSRSSAARRHPVLRRGPARAHAQRRRPGHGSHAGRGAPVPPHAGHARVRAHRRQEVRPAPAGPRARGSPTSRACRCRRWPVRTWSRWSNGCTSRAPCRCSTARTSCTWHGCLATVQMTPLTRRTVSEPRTLRALLRGCRHRGSASSTRSSRWVCGRSPSRCTIGQARRGGAQRLGAHQSRERGGCPRRAPAGAPG